jgi:sulfatase modifying factor 1
MSKQKSRSYYFVIVPLALLVLLTGCPAPGSSGPEAGDQETFSAGGVTFNMVYVPGKSFKTGTDDLGGTATVTNEYWIGETEITYELWSDVYDWAVNGIGGATGEGDYSFDNAGVMGDGTGDTDQHPVTTINWRDAMVWMNALTEYYNAQNGTTLECLYYYDAAYNTPIRDSLDDDSHTTEEDGDYTGSVNPNAGGFDDPYIKSDADGFRLATSNEWELAARYIDDANDDGDIEDANEYYPGNYASGATADYNDGTATNAVAVYDENGNGSADDSAASVKSKNANALSIYDMSGNAFEWCFDWHTVGSNRVRRGGSWDFTAYYMQVGDEFNYNPYNELNVLGFRLARTQ